MQRFSKNRQAVLDCLRGTDTHPTAEWIYRQLKPEYPSLSLATVYRNLTQLKEAGLIRSLEAVNGQERFDANTAPHTHAVCRVCGRTVDVPQVTLPPYVIELVEAAAGYRVSDTDLRFIGLCAQCAGKEKN